MTEQLGSPLKTPCGLVFSNRLMKAAMAESMADDNSDPDEKYITAYDTWSSGGWGGILTGEVEVSTTYMGHPSNVNVPSTPNQSTRDAWIRWALACQQHGTPAFPQLVHPGRQSPAATGQRSFFAKALAPSAIPMKLGPGTLDWLLSKVLFGTPRAMTLDDIETVVTQFANAAKLAHESGFKGVQIHAAHGFLLTQFLSPTSNSRTDAYGGTPANRSRIVIDVIRAIRARVPPSFCVGIKVNSADVGGEESLADSLEQIGLIAAEAIDFIEISGGTMENLRMAKGDKQQPEKSAHTRHREAFFLDYARAVRARYPDILLMLTGGFRSRAGMRDALESGACDIVGVGRPAVIWPKLPKETMLNPDVGDEDARVELRFVTPTGLAAWVPLKLVGAGADVLYYAGQILRLATGKKTVAPAPLG